MTDQSSKNGIEESGKLPEQPAKVSRRALLRGGVTAMPAILTLQSGAALARTSNLLVSAAHRGTTDRLGRTLCLDTNSVYPAGGSGDVYDLGDPPRAELNIISDRVYYADRNGRSDKVGIGKVSNKRVSKSAMCEGGTFYYNDRDGTGWHSVELPYRGIVVSSGAMISISDYVIDTLI